MSQKSKGTPKMEKAKSIGLLSGRTTAEKKGYEIAGRQREQMNSMLGHLLSLVEASLGDSKQAEGLKNLIKIEVWRTTDINQQSMYNLLTGKEGFPVSMTEDGTLE